MVEAPEKKVKSKKLVLTTIGENGPKKGHVTNREREILQLISDGFNNKEIAEMLELSEKTVANHTQNLRMRFEVSKVIPLIKVALKKGIIS